LKVVRIQTPALREITEDIPFLANHFLTKHCELAGIPLKRFAPAAIERLKLYAWPGNTRQLENEVKRLVASVRGPLIGSDQFELSAEPATEISQVNALPSNGKTINEAVEAIERRMIQDALRKYQWNKQKAAQELGLSRQGLIKKLKRLEITR
jgi:two-component system response regulator HupR/HoxA